MRVPAPGTGRTSLADEPVAAQLSACNALRSADCQVAALRFGRKFAAEQSAAAAKTAGSKDRKADSGFSVLPPKFMSVVMMIKENANTGAITVIHVPVDGFINDSSDHGSFPQQIGIECILRLLNIAGKHFRWVVHYRDPRRLHRQYGSTAGIDFGARRNSV